MTDPGCGPTPRLCATAPPLAEDADCRQLCDTELKAGAVCATVGPRLATPIVTTPPDNDSTPPLGYRGLLFLVDPAVRDDQARAFPVAGRGLRAHASWFTVFVLLA